MKTASQVKELIFVSRFNSDDVKAWSGIPYYMLRSLQAQGVKVYPIDSVDFQYSRWMHYKKKGLCHLRNNTNFWDHYDAGALRQMSESVDAQVQALNLNEDVPIFSIHPDPVVFIKSPNPLYFFSDATFAALLEHYPSLKTLHPYTVQQGHTLWKTATARAAGSIFCSEWAANSAVHDYAADSNKVHVLPMGANHERTLNLSDIEQSIESRSQTICRLLWMGVEWERKGAAEAIQITTELKERYGLNVELNMVGCQPPDGVVIPDYVKLLGFINKSEAEGERYFCELFEQSHFLLLPTQAECFGLVFAEASSFGVPSIAPAIGGVPSAVKDGVSGLLFPLESFVEKAVSSIDECFQDREHYQKLCRSAYQHYAEVLNWDAFSKSLLQVMKLV